MSLWGRWEQCKNCYFECGEDDVVSLREDGTLEKEHEYSCSKGEKCDTDFPCKLCTGEE